MRRYNTKRALIGCWLTLLGTLWGAGVLIAASQMLVNSWDPTIGRLMSTIMETGLIYPFVVSVLFLLVGLAIMAIAFFQE